MDQEVWAHLGEVLLFLTVETAKSTQSITAISITSQAVTTNPRIYWEVDVAALDKALTGDSTYKNK